MLGLKCYPAGTSKLGTWDSHADPGIMGKWGVESYLKSDRSSLPTVEPRKILSVCSSSLAGHLLLESRFRTQDMIVLCPRDLGAITREIQGTCRRHSCSHTGQSTQVTAVKDGAHGLGLARWVDGWERT